MKEDILEQLVDEYLMHKGYFTMHNMKFKPRKDHPEYVTNKDSSWRATSMCLQSIPCSRARKR